MTKPSFMEVDSAHFHFLKKQLNDAQSLKISMKGTSMEPLYNCAGEPIEVHCVKDVQNLKRFDLLVFWQNNILVFHYLWSINKVFNDSPENPTLITRPLNPIRGYDHPVTFHNLLGIVKDKKMSNWTKFKIYLFTLIEKK